jgi:hypothetical protein
MAFATSSVESVADVAMKTIQGEFFLEEKFKTIPKKKKKIQTKNFP